jgi:glycosyltransferase involved in cell wall biosynthesis
VAARPREVDDAPGGRRWTDLPGQGSPSGSTRWIGPLRRGLLDEQLAEAYATARIFAMPARHRLEPRPEGEGFGLVYLEAAAAGLPVVAGAGGGVEDAVEDGESGMLVDAHDVDAVADAIVRLLSDRSLARRMGERGRDLAAHNFSYETFRERIGELVRDLGPAGLR